MIQSPLLTQFWGRPVFIGAHVLLPAGFATHPQAHYPLMVFHGHFPDDFGASARNADPNLKPDYSERFHLAGYNRIQQQAAYDFYQKWISPGFPRYIVIEIEHANPYYDDSYAVNSANLGPYGDAINHELIPYIEQKFRGLGQGWARFTYGGSTGGVGGAGYPGILSRNFITAPSRLPRSDRFSRLYGGEPVRRQECLHIAGPGDERGAACDPQLSGRECSPLSVTATTWNLRWATMAAAAGRTTSGRRYSPSRRRWLSATCVRQAERRYRSACGGLLARALRSGAHHPARLEYSGPRSGRKIHIYVGSADTYYLNDAVYFAQAVLEGLKNRLTAARWRMATAPNIAGTAIPNWPTLIPG